MAKLQMGQQCLVVSQELRTWQLSGLAAGIDAYTFKDTLFISATGPLYSSAAILNILIR